MGRFKSFFRFSGRIGRQEFWITYLASFFVQGLGFAALALLFNLDDNGDPVGDISAAQEISAGLVMLAFGFFVGWLFIAQTCKRWHDRNKSGWYSLLILVPLIGPIWLLIECGFLRGTEGPNRFGPDTLNRP
jgi:uncharacterized membrane protein YhaH (DUF805 family)